VVVKELLAAGVHFIDEAQSRKIRSVTDAGQLMGGTISPVITSLDADVIVAGLCHLDVLKSDLLGSNAHRYDAVIEARAISVATGQVLGVFQARGQAMGFVARQAAQQAAGIAAKDVARQILEVAKRPQATPKIELTVTGIPDLRAGERVRKAVEAIDGVTKLAVAQAARGMTKLVFETGGREPRDVALDIDGTSGLGVVVIGYSDRAIKAEYRLEAAIALDVLIGAWSNKSGRKRDAWLSATLPGVVGTSLSNLSFLRFPGEGKARAIGDAPKAWKKALRKAKADPAKSLVVTGSLQRKGDSVTVQTSIRAGKTGAVVLAGQRTCPATEAPDCTADLADELADKLLASLQAKRHLFKASLAAAQSARAGDSGKPVRVVSVEVDNLFPARMGVYSRVGLGHLVVKNTGDEPVSEVVLNSDLKGYTGGAVDTRGEDIAPGAEARIPIRLVLAKRMLTEHRENQPAVLALTLNYVLGDFHVIERRSQAVVVYDRNAVSWSAPNSVAAFVTPASVHVQSIARDVASALPKALQQHPLARPAALFSALTRQGLSYVKDPVNPHAEESLDYVQFPEQTLEAGAGDCDDLAVLYVALSEAMGHRAVLVTTPGHIFAAVATGLPVQSSSTLSFEEGAMLEHEGALWVPVETTLVDKTMAEAWKAGADELARWKAEPDKVRVIDVRRAWATYPPVDLSTPALRVKSVVAKALIGDVNATMEAAKQDRSAWLTKRLAEVNLQLAKDGDNAEGLHAKGQVLFHQGKTAEARALFERASKDPTLAQSAYNNLANLQLVEGHAKQALETYRRAAELNDQDARVQLNAAMAAFAAGDEDSFGEHIFNCIDLGAELAVNQLSQSGVMATSGTTGADSEGLAMRELRSAVQRAFKRAGRTMVKAPETRASDAATLKVPVDRYLHWL
jgi:tetratricopeptide (TPR) repeat protein